MAVPQLCRQHGFSPASLYQWRAKFAGMEAEDAQDLRALEQENHRLKMVLAGAHMDIKALRIGFGAKC